MKIAYIIYPEVIISNRSNGVRAQAVSWGEGLKKQGHEVVFISNWENYDWKSFDAIHFFGFGKWVYPVAKRISKINNKLIISPIIDPPIKPSYIKYNIKFGLSKLLGNKINFNVNNYDEAKALSLFSIVNVRSLAEKLYIEKIYKIKSENIEIVPLCFDSQLCGISYNLQEKDNFCLHISSIYQERKNVVRLVQAAKKYGFNLVLAGNKGTKEQYELIEKAIGNASNIRVLGFISTEEKIKLYQQAKVFALPSLQEGVGIVALDAALMGCEIVITNIPGPKEYYFGKCIEVNPLSVDEIGQAVMTFLSGKEAYQPYLSSMISDEYSSSVMIEKLEKMYNHANK